MYLFNKAPSRTHVIEFYAYSDEYVDQVKHEIITGTDSGQVLAKLNGQQIRFIYAPDKEKENLVIKESKDRGYGPPIFNLSNSESLNVFLSRVGEGDSLLITGQGDAENQLLAGRDAESLVEILLDDFKLANIKLKNLDIYSCRMGRVKEYRFALREQLTNFQTITTYTELCSVSQDARLWIELSEKGDFFYQENEIDEKGIRITEHTQNGLKELWRANPNNPEEIDISDCINLRYKS